MNKLALTLLAALLAFQLPALAGPKWTTDLPAAQAKAKKENKLVLINFTGSDWCAWCQTLKEEVFSTREFAQYAKTNLVLVEIDFPEKKRQRKKLKESNEALQENFKVDGYPTIVVLNGEGKELWRGDYMEGGPKAWIAQLNSLPKK